MPGRLLLHAPTTLEYFGALVADDATFSVLETSIAIAHVDYPSLDCQSVLAEVDTLAARLKTRLPSDAASMQRLRLLNRFFFQELGFAGNVNDYYDPKNSYLHNVLQTRRGIPITLAVLYVEIASQVGLAACGISFPGHFLVKVRMPQGDVVIDPFTGQSMSRDALDVLLVPYRRRQGLPGGTQLPLGLFLQEAAPREIVARMLRNLKEIHRAQEDWQRLIAVQNRLLVLLPDAWAEYRDRGLAHAEQGHAAKAVDDLETYLVHAQDALDIDAIADRVADLRRARH